MKYFRTPFLRMAEQQVVIWPVKVFIRVNYYSKNKTEQTWLSYFLDKLTAVSGCYQEYCCFL